MKLKTSCPSCTASLSVEADLVGKHAKCPQCRTKFVIEEVRTPRSAQSVEQAAAAVETVADGTTTAGAKRDGSAAAASGKTLGRFEIQGVLGQGGFGRVYKAYDPQLDRILALKVPTFGPQDVQKAKRFQKEAKAAAQLRHPNIVPTFDSGKAGNQFFIATQFIEGEPLSKATELGPVEPRLAAEWCAKIADALAYAHEMGIVHRDVKPHNVMLDARSEPQLMDFGLAKRVNEDSTMTSEGSLLGTPAYMAPEQARGDTSLIGPHTDQYAVGAILYELLSGQRAFEGAPHVVLTQIVSQEPPGLRSINPAIPQDLEAIAQKAMSKEIDGRYDNCEELAADLRSWLRGDATLARPITPRERFQRWAKRNRGLAAAFGGTAVALLLAAGLGVAFAVYQTKAKLEVSAAQETTNEALTTAKTERDNAQKERDVAQKERDRAETEKERAEKERTRAEEQTKLAATRLEASQANEYVANIRSAAAKWDAGDADGANAALDAARPKDGDRDRRGWEWNYLWNLGHSEIMTIDTQSTTNGGGFVFFYPDNKTVFAGAGGIGAAWDSRTGDLKYQLAGEESCFSGCCSVDGRWLYTGNQNGEVTCWDAITGERKYTIAAHAGQLKHATGKPYAFVTEVAVSGNGSRLVSYSYHDQEVKVWDTSTQEQVSALNRQNYQWDITTIALSVDGRVATMQGPLGHAAIWDTNTGQVLRQLTGNGQYLSGAVCRSPDSKLVVGAGTRGIVVWNAETGERVEHQLSRYQGESEILWVQYSADGTQLLTAEFGAIKVWDCQTGQVVQEFKAPPGAYGSSADGRKLALRTGDGVIHIWDLVSGTSPLSLRSNDPQVPVDNPMFTGGSFKTLLG